MLEHIIFVLRGASNDTALTMRARTWGEILPCECGDFLDFWQSRDSQELLNFYRPLKAKKKKSCKSCDLQDTVAEREGFEPPEV